MEKNSLTYLINGIFKILGLYEKIQNEDENFTKENYIIYIEKTIIDIQGFMELYKSNEVMTNILNRCYFSVIGILEMVKSDADKHKMIRSKVLDMTNDISRYLIEGE